MSRGVRVKMIKTGLAFLAVSFFIAPSGLSQEMYSIGLVGEYPNCGVVFGEYRDRAWEESAFAPAGEFVQNFNPALAAGPSGEFWAVWAARNDGEESRIYFSRGRSGAWSSARRVTAGGEQWEQDPAIVVWPDGAVLAAWAGTLDGRSGIYCARREGDGFAPPKMVSPPSEFPLRHPALAVDSSGRALLVWQGWDGSYYQIFASFFDGQEWSEVEMIAPRPGVDQTLPSVFSGDDGRWECFWVEGGKLFSAAAGPGGWAGPEPAGSFPDKVIPRAEEPPSPGWLVERDAAGRPRTRRTGVLFDLARILPPSGVKAAAGQEYIAYGDSITLGWNSAAGRQDINYSYIPYLRSKLQSRYGVSYTIHNQGYGGHITYSLAYGGTIPGKGYCPGINGVIDSYPNASRILIMAGTNDGCAPSASRDFLSVMIDRARSRGCTPILATMIPRCDGDQSRVDSLSRDYIRPLARAKGCTLADPWQYFYNYGNWPGQLLEDCLHVTIAGAQTMANAFFAAIPPPYYATPVPRKTPPPTPTLTPTVTPSPSPSPLPLFSLIDSGDYDGDGTADLAVFRPSSGLWAIRGVTRAYWGKAGGSDVPVPGDYGADGTSDIAAYRPVTGFWFIRDLTRVYWGKSGDVPVPGDYDGDGTADLGVFRPSSGLWAVRGVTRAYWGKSGDIPVPGYFRGTRQKSIAAYRPSTGYWFVKDLTRVYWGKAGDEPVPFQSNPSSACQIGVFRRSSGLWAVRGVTRAYWGKQGGNDIPVPGNYEGDGDDAIAAYRPSTGYWFIKGITKVFWGKAGDIPVSGPVPRR